MKYLLFLILICENYLSAANSIESSIPSLYDHNVWYVIFLGISAVTFLWLRKIWHNLVPDIFYWIHFTIVCWSGIMYMNIIFETPLKNFAYYADWIISTPLIMLAIGLTAMYPFKKLSWSSIFGVIATQLMVVVTGILAQLCPTQIGKIAYFTIGNIFMLLIFYFIFGPFMQIAKENKIMLQKYKVLAYFFTGFWLLYPLVWIIGTPGYQLISPYFTSLLFVILPLFCKPVFGLIDIILLYYAHKQMKG